MSSKRPGSKKTARKPGGKPRQRRAQRKKRPVAAASLSRPLVLFSGTGPLLAECIAALERAPYDIGVYMTDANAVADHIPKTVKRYTRPNRTASLAIDVTLADRQMKERALRSLDRAFGPETLILTNAFAIPVTEQVSWISGKHRLLGVGLLPGACDRTLVEIAPSAMTARQTVEAARRFFRGAGREVEIVQDRAGLVSARMICQIINEAAFALQDDIASPEDIDTSMKLGVSYPYGPFEWAERIGIDNVVAILKAIQSEYQEERYRIAPLLHRMALGGVWWRSHRASAHVGEDS